MTAKEAAMKALKDGPLPFNDLAERVLSTSGVKLAGKTPKATIRKTLDRSPEFKRTAPGIYGLAPDPKRELTADLAPSKREATPDPKPASNKRRQKTT